MSHPSPCYRYLIIGLAAIFVSAAPAESADPPARTYTTDVDYPPAALRAREQGTVEFRATVGPEGRVTECTITHSSGSASLDAATCELMRTRARFTPARENGNPTSETINSRFRWVLPRH
jgi:protein TonB